MNIVTVKTGTKYESNDVNILYRNIYTDNFYCYTDDPEGLDPGIKVLSIKEEYEGVWNKLSLFDFDLGKVLYLDLDVVIQNNINELYNVDSFTLVSCYWKPLGELYDGYLDNLDHNINSSVMVWNGRENKHILDKFREDPEWYMLRYPGIDGFMFHEGIKYNVWPQGLIYSWKYGTDITSWYTPAKVPYYLEDGLICLFNGDTDKKDRLDFFNLINN